MATARQCVSPQRESQRPTTPVSMGQVRCLAFGAMATAILKVRRYTLAQVSFGLVNMVLKEVMKSTLSCLGATMAGLSSAMDRSTERRLQ